jgi:hypothetical protein
MDYVSSMMPNIIGILELVLVSIGIWQFSQLVGNKDTQNNISAVILPVILIISGIILLHTLLWYYYFTLNPSSMNLYFLISGSISMIISVTAVSISLTSQQ